MRICLTLSDIMFWDKSVCEMLTHEYTIGKREGNMLQTHTRTKKTLQLEHGKQSDINIPEGCISFFCYGSNGWMYFLRLARRRDECQHDKYFLINP